MLKEFLWETFKKTGNIEAYVFYKEIENDCKSKSESEVEETAVEIECVNEEVASTG